jgi:hypothetical protein
MEIRVSTHARRYISKKSGELYVYFDPIDRTEWMVQRVGLARPPDHDFVAHEHEGIRVWLDSDFDPPKRLEVRRAWWRFGPLEVAGTGAGQAEGAYSGDGGSWPGHGGGGGGDGGGHGGHGGH